MKILVFILSLGFQVAGAQALGPQTASSGPVESEALFANEKLAAAPAGTEKIADVKSAKNESEIPLNFEAEKKASPSEGLAGKIAYSLIVLFILGAGMIYAVKRYSIPKNSKSQTQIKVITQHHFGPKKSIALVRIAGESLLIGITDQNINMIKSLALLDEDVPEDVPQNFSKTLKESDETTSEEDFAITGIKDVVHKKIKSMRSFQ